MVLPGYRYTMKISRIEVKGAWLDGQGTEILLPRSQCPADIRVGMDLDVFVYRDSSNSLMATTVMPAAQVGEFAFLKVCSTGPHGAFLDWGLPKDLLAPFQEQARKMEEGRRYLVRICLDGQDRPIASSRLDKFLYKENRDLNEGEQVEVLVWAFTDLGAKVIVNNLYEAVIYKTDLSPDMTRGDRVTGYVARIRPDGRLDITLSRPGAAGVQDARATILEALAESGSLPLHDQSPPELIRARLGLSKKAFKKAVGGLYKDKLIDLTHQGIKLRRS